MPVKNKWEIPVNLWFQKMPKIGDIGIEIECEGENLGRRPPVPWQAHHDGSLRGEECIEYITNGPVPYGESLKALENLQKYCIKNRSIIEDSHRTSVHIHINILPLTLRELYNFMVLYLVMEDVLVEYSGGKERVGNLFCLRASDAEYQVDILARAAQNFKFNDFARQEFRYASMNVCSVSKFGSLEFRSHRGLINPDIIYAWVRTLMGLRDQAQGGLGSPERIIEQFSIEGPMEFIKRRLPKDVYQKILLFDNVEQRLRDGMRLIQDIAFAVDWSEPDSVKWPKDVAEQILEQAPRADEPYHEWAARQGPFQRADLEVPEPAPRAPNRMHQYVPGGDGAVDNQANAYVGQLNAYVDQLQAYQMVAGNHLDPWAIGVNEPEPQLDQIVRHDIFADDVEVDYDAFDDDVDEPNYEEDEDGNF